MDDSRLRARPDPASYRDPSSQVLVAGGRILRGLDPEAAHAVFSGFPAFELVDWEAVMAHGFPHAAFDG